MALVSISGRGAWMPDPMFPFGAPGLSSTLLDASTKKVAFAGRVWFPGRTGTKDISRVQFRFGTVVKAGGSGLTVSLQDASLTSGPPIQPDETQDQTVAVANGDSSFASNQWYRTGTLSANRTVSFGSLLAVVIEFDGSGRLGSDTVNIASFSATTPYNYVQGVTLLKSSGSWANQGVSANVVLEFSDGTFGTIDGAYVVSAVNTHTFASNTAGSDEYAMEFQLPWPCRVDGATINVIAGSTVDFEVNLYDGTTIMGSGNGSVAVDGNTGTTAARMLVVPFGGEIALAANTTYRLSIRPTTTNSITVYSIDVNDANHWTLHGGGTTWKYTTRVDQGAWAAATTTRRLFAGLRMSAFDDGAGGGGGVMTPSRGILTGGRM